MKVITLKQPWATLVVEGYKKYEFRSWKYNYRGKIYIHAGKGIDKEAMEKIKHLNLEFPSQKIIGTVEINDCILLTEEINLRISLENNLLYGNKNRKGYAWVLQNAHKIDIEKTISGKQGIWNYD